jgi:PPOX class probable FMN-dependent enzyme
LNMGHRIAAICPSRGGRFELEQKVTLDRFTRQIRSADELSSLFGAPSIGSLKKELRCLDEHMRRFIAHAPFLVLSTHSADGRCDASPRGDAAGFVKVVDERTLLIPDRRGNKRLDSLRNVLETGWIGLLFLVPGFGETLRVNGRAVIIRDDEWLAALSANGRQPLAAIAVEVQECYLQCAKAVLRSNLWEPTATPDQDTLPSAAQMFADHMKLPEYDVATMQALLDESYRNNLY